MYRMKSRLEHTKYRKEEGAIVGQEVAELFEDGLVIRNKLNDVEKTDEVETAF